ncbi:hypothetical protein KKD62_01350 [Patescibacteria group bacterium]|nr:hypothetical protein [Patescibacteria group bacterium]MBU1931652.1 hypothetical protein [Patescibacteria group bacterium]
MFGKEFVSGQHDGKEPGVQDWVPMRQRAMGQPRIMEAGPFVWQPQFILYAEHLEVNSLAFALLPLLGLEKPIKIVSYNPPKDNDGPVTMLGSISASGEAVITGALGRVKRPKNAGVFRVNQVSDGIELLVNFIGIADYVEAVLPDGRRHPQFFERYGAEIDRAIRGKMKQLPILNFLLHGVEQPGVFYSELMGFAINSLAAIVVAGIGSSMVIKENPHDPEAVIPLLLACGLLYEFGWTLHNAITVWLELRNPTTDSIRKAYADYLIEKVAVGDLLGLLYPENLTNYLFLPLLGALAWNKTLIRGK